MCVHRYLFILAKEPKDTLAEREDDEDWNEENHDDDTAAVQKHTAPSELASAVGLGRQCLLCAICADHQRCTKNACE